MCGTLFTCMQHTVGWYISQNESNPIKIIMKMFTHICCVNTNIFPMRNCSFRFNNKSNISLDLFSASVFAILYFFFLSVLPSMCLSLSLAWHKYQRCARSADDKIILCLPSTTSMRLHVVTSKNDDVPFHIFFMKLKYSKKTETVFTNDDGISKRFVNAVAWCQLYRQSRTHLEESIHNRFYLLQR